MTGFFSTLFHGDLYDWYHAKWVFTESEEFLGIYVIFYQAITSYSEIISYYIDLTSCSNTWYINIFVYYFRVNLLRPMVSREPEAMWNLFDIIKSLLRAQDSNSVQILQIVTEELLNFPQLPLWWFVASTEVDSNCFIGNSTSVMQQNHTSANSVSAGYARNTVARLFDEIVQLWKTVMIVPCGMFTNRDKIKDRLVSWHEMALEKTRRGKPNEIFIATKVCIELCGVEDFHHNIVLFPSFPLSICFCPPQIR